MIKIIFDVFIDIFIILFIIFLIGQVIDKCKKCNAPNIIIECVRIGVKSECREIIMDEDGNGE